MNSLNRNDRQTNSTIKKHMGMIKFPKGKGFVNNIND